MTGRAASSSSVPGTPETPRARELDRVVDLLFERFEERERRSRREPWVDAKAVGVHLGVSADVVRENWRQLGGVRIGDGPRARLRFRLDRVDDLLEGATAFRGGRESAGSGSGVTRRRRRVTGTGAPLIPYTVREGGRLSR